MSRHIEDKRRKCITRKYEVINMLLGNNVKLNKIMEFEKSLLVGRFQSCEMGVASLKN
jgi:hypothetical protein